MYWERKTILLWLGSYIGTAFFFRLQRRMNQISQDFIHQYTSILLGISILWILLTFIQNTKDNNTKKLKSISIFFWSYLISILLIKPSLNLNHIEFFIWYYSSYSLFNSLGEVSSLKKRIKIWFFMLILLFLLSINFFMIYRKPADKESFFKNEKYQLFSNKEDRSEYPDFLKITTENISKKIPLPPKKNQVLNKDKNYVLEYQSTDYNSNNRLLLSSPKWELLKIFPQSKLYLSTTNNSFKYSTTRGKTKILLKWKNKENNNNSDFWSFFHNYDKRLQKYILNQLPLNYQKNWELQRYSYNYTLFLWTYLPFYQKNKEYAKSFKPYLLNSSITKRENKPYNRENTYRNWNIWLWKTNNIKKWKMWIKNYFSTFF